MDRIILSGTNTHFPRASSLAAISNSGVVPDSAAGGSCHPVETTNAPKGAGSVRVRRPRATVKQAMRVVWLWDIGEFDTAEIAKAMRLHEAEVESILHHIREERRARG